MPDEEARQRDHELTEVRAEGGEGRTGPGHQDHRQGLQEDLQIGEKGQQEVNVTERREALIPYFRPKFDPTYLQLSNIDAPVFMLVDVSTSP